MVFFSEASQWIVITKHPLWSETEPTGNLFPLLLRGMEAEGGWQVHTWKLYEDAYKCYWVKWIEGYVC